MVFGGVFGLLGSLCLFMFLIFSIVLEPNGEVGGRPPSYPPSVFFKGVGRGSSSPLPLLRGGVGATSASLGEGAKGWRVKWVGGAPGGSSPLNMGGGGGSTPTPHPHPTTRPPTKNQKTQKPKNQKKTKNQKRQSLLCREILFYDL